MAIDDFLSHNKLMLLYEKYDSEYIDKVFNGNFSRIYNLFLSRGFNYIDDIIVNYLEIFDLDYDYANEGLLNLANYLGDNYIFLIGEDMRYLKYLLTDRK